MGGLAFFRAVGFHPCQLVDAPFDWSSDTLPSIDNFMTWYNEVRPHGAFDLSRAQTHLEMFYERMADQESIADPSLLTRGWNDLG